MSPSTFVLNLPAEFGWVLLTALLMGLSCILIGFFFAGRVRGQIFTQEYLKENFGAEHQRVTGEEIKKGGYPDSGSGFYSRNLNYEQWYKMNNGQRAHLNYIEWIATNITFHVVGGLYFPVVSSVLGALMVLSRFVYAWGYVSGGPSSRIGGAVINDLITLVQLVLGVISCVKMINGTEYSEGL